MAKKIEYGQFCPVAMAAQILAVRWMPLVVRELLAGSTRFNDLHRGLPLISPSLLSSRLKELEQAGVIDRTPAPNGKGFEYLLTEAGRELGPIVFMYGFWADKWLKRDYTESELDPSLLMWDIRRNVVTDVFPAERRAVVEFELSGVKSGQRRWWVLFERGDTDLCMKDPGYGIDLYVRAPVRALTEVWMGRRNLTEALKTEAIQLEGSRPEIKNFSKWFSLNFFANAENPLLASS